MNLFVSIIISLLVESLTALPDIEQRPLKVASLKANERNTDASTNDLGTSDTYAFAYYPQYYATNMNNPTMASNGFGQSHYNTPKNSSPISNTASSGTSAVSGNGIGTGNGAGNGVSPFNGVATPASSIQFLATPIYTARLNIVPYEITMPIRVRSNPKNDNGQFNRMNGQGSFDRRNNGNSPFDKNPLSIGIGSNGGGNGHANTNGGSYGVGYGNGYGGGKGIGTGTGTGTGNGNGGGYGGMFYNDLHHQNGRRYPVY